MVQENFNPAENFVELSKRLTNFEESRRQLDDMEEDQHVALSAKNASIQIGINSSFRSHPRKFSLNVVVTKTQDMVLYVTNVDI